VAAGVDLVCIGQSRLPDLDNRIRSVVRTRAVQAGRLLIVLSVTAIGAICTNLGVGNYGLIMLALLTGAYRRIRRDAPFWRVCCWAWRCSSRNLLHHFTDRGAPRTISRGAAAALYVVVATIAMWIISGIGPLVMLEQSAQMAGAFAKTTAGLLTVVLEAGVPYRLAAPLTALLCAAIFTPILWRNRDRIADAPVRDRGGDESPLDLQSKHLESDLVFLLLALWRLAIETRDMRATGLFIAVGASLWVPASLSEHHVVQLAEHLTWLAGIIGLLILDSRPQFQKISRRKIKYPPQPLAGESPSR